MAARHHRAASRVQGSGCQAVKALARIDMIPLAVKLITTINHMEDKCNFHSTKFLRRYHIYRDLY
jgi:hypothetical protein